MDYVPHTQQQIQEMLKTIGVSGFDELISTVPSALHSRELDVPSGLSEPEVLAHAEALAGRNRPLREVAAFLGAGAYRHVIPTVVDAVSSRGE